MSKIPYLDLILSIASSYMEINRIQVRPDQKKKTTDKRKKIKRKMQKKSRRKRKN